MRRKPKKYGLYLFLLGAMAAGILLTLCLPCGVTLGIFAALTIILLVLCIKG